MVRLNKKKVSAENRLQIIESYNRGISTSQISLTLQILRGTINSILKIYINTSRTVALKRGSPNGKKINEASIFLLSN